MLGTDPWQGPLMTFPCLLAHEAPGPHGAQP